MRRCIFFLFAILAFAQDDAVFRATTQLVRIDVVAQDKNGKPVADLGKDDFELKVSGKRQQIDTFTVTSAASTHPDTLPRGTFSNKQAAADVSQGRYTVFLLDWRNTNWQLELSHPKSVSIGAVYVTLDRLEEKGLVSSWLSDPTPERGGRAKRCYRLEPSGRRALEEAAITARRIWESTATVWGRNWAKEGGLK